MEKGKNWMGWAVFLLAAGAALWLVRSAYEKESGDPWTRAGLVQAALVLVASPISGTAESGRVQSSSEVEEG